MKIKQLYTISFLTALRACGETAVKKLIKLKFREINFFTFGKLTNPIFELKLKLLSCIQLGVRNNYDCFYGKDWCKFNTSWT